MKLRMRVRTPDSKGSNQSSPRKKRYRWSYFSGPLQGGCGNGSSNFTTANSAPQANAPC
jgi:hypothetical protein